MNNCSQFARNPAIAGKLASLYCTPYLLCVKYIIPNHCTKTATFSTIKDVTMSQYKMNILGNDTESKFIPSRFLFHFFNFFTSSLLLFSGNILYLDTVRDAHTLCFAGSILTVIALTLQVLNWKMNIIFEQLDYRGSQ